MATESKNKNASGCAKFPAFLGVTPLISLVSRVRCTRSQWAAFQPRREIDTRKCCRISPREFEILPVEVEDHLPFCVLIFKKNHARVSI
jgi:hypothetical protein